jgi:hypothetical protein
MSRPWTPSTRCYGTCRAHCRGRKYIEHRTDGPHQCDDHEGDQCPRNNPQGCGRCRRMCKPHKCEGLSASTIRQIHRILSGALDRAVVWKWISVNPAEQADKPGLPIPNPQPPTPGEIASRRDSSALGTAPASALLHPQALCRRNRRAEDRDAAVSRKPDTDGARSPRTPLPRPARP